MKRLFAMLLALCLLMGAGAYAFESAQGVWHLNAIETDGMRIDPSSVGMGIILSLYTDGSAVLSLSGEGDLLAIWSEGAGFVRVGDGTDGDLILSYEGAQLVSEDDGMRLIFGREKHELTQEQVSPARADAQLADYEGDWQATHMTSSGMYIPMDAIGTQAGLSLRGTQAVLNISGEETYGEAFVSGGRLYVISERGETVFTLYEDGTISFVLATVGDMGPTQATVYFSRTGE